MTVGKKRSRIGGQYVVEIDADIRKLAKDRRGKAELRPEEIAWVARCGLESFALDSLLNFSSFNSH
jgi:hypothetical protein